MAQLSDENEPGAGRENHSVRRIRRIAELIGAQRYLEVGVMRGGTFNALTFPKKVAVDPNFRFDTGPFEKDGVEFHKVTSDKYFVQNGLDEKFDIMFLDGLHTFQQIFRDFCNSLLCATDTTVWLIDDVLPNDVYGAHPNQGIAREHKARGWFGDVFKVVFAIHDFFPALKYVTIAEKNPQMMIWKPREHEYERPLYNNLEAIERMTFFDLKDHEDVMKLTPEIEAMKLLAETKRPNAD